MAQPSLTSRGAETRRALLATSREQFVEHGYAAFSLRSVAKAAGMSLGHLQYFFPTKNALVTAMLTDASADYLRTYNTYTRSLDLQPWARLEAVLRYLLDDARNPRTIRFFVELWAVTNHDDDAHRVLCSHYRRNRQSFWPLIRDARPDLTDEAAEALALQIIAMVDGLIVFAHSERPSEAEFDAVALRVMRDSLETVRRS
ncbi:TetR/AcrR family transcriptional regulator [Modestobacter sp. URMC 112]